jgi:hypothetical protein
MTETEAVTQPARHSGCCRQRNNHSAYPIQCFFSFVFVSHSGDASARGARSAGSDSRTWLHASKGAIGVNAIIDVETRP